MAIREETIRFSTDPSFSKGPNLVCIKLISTFFFATDNAGELKRS